KPAQTVYLPVQPDVHHQGDKLMNKLSLVLLVAAGFGLAACGSTNRAYQSSADAPRVSYTYEEGADHAPVKERADEHGDEEVALTAVLLSRDAQGSSYEVTVACQWSTGWARRRSLPQPWTQASAERGDPDAMTTHEHER